MLTILDPEPLTEEDLGTKFFVNEAQVGQNRAEAAFPEVQKLSPRVEIYTDGNAAVTKDRSISRISLSQSLPVSW